MTFTNTTGTVRVARCNALTIEAPEARTTSGASARQEACHERLGNIQRSAASPAAV
jgi:hypothetical protein